MIKGLFGVSLLVIAGGAVAAGGGAPAQTPAQFTALLKCRELNDEAQRLACYDRSVEELQAATQKHELVVVDRAHITTTRKRLFGLSLPNINLFGDGDGDDSVDSVEGTVAVAQIDEHGLWRIQLQDGAVWEQVGERPIRLRPRPGSKVEIRRASLGSFIMRIDGRPGVKVRRTR